MANFVSSVKKESNSQDLLLKSREPNVYSRRQMKLDNKLLCLLDHNVPDHKLCVFRDLLKKGANYNASDSSGNRPIHLAINHSPGNTKLVLELISYGAHINVVNKEGATPLTYSLYNRCHETTEILIKRRIDLNFQCRRGWTPLMIATMLGDLKSVRILLLNGADVNKCDKNQSTALMFACEGTYLDVIKELLAYGANPAMRDNKNNSSLLSYLKRPYPNLEVINELLLHCACFSDLENNPEESFLQIMNKCVRGQPPYHACVKTIVKIQMLITDDYRCVTSFGDLYNYAASCCAEVRFMDGFEVNGSKSLKCLLKNCLEGYMPSETELEALLPFVANNNFPIYSDILMALLRKPFLKEKFKKTLLSTKGQGYRITLHFDINSHIMSYLSDNDISNFVLASFIKFD